MHSYSLFKPEPSYQQQLDKFIQANIFWARTNPQAVEVLKGAMESGLITEIHLATFKAQTIQLLVGGHAAFLDAHEHGIIALNQLLVTPESIDDLIKLCLDNREVNFAHVAVLFTDAGQHALRTNLITIDRVERYIRLNKMDHSIPFNQFIHDHPIWAQRDRLGVLILYAAMDEGLMTERQLQTLEFRTFALFVGERKGYLSARENGITALREKLVTLESMNALMAWCMARKGCDTAYCSVLLTDHGLEALRRKLITVNDAKEYVNPNGMEAYIHLMTTRPLGDSASYQAGGCTMS